MKSIITILFFAIGLSNNIYCQQIIFQKTYPPPANSLCHRPNYGMSGVDIAVCSDSNIMVLGGCTMGGDSCSSTQGDKLTIRIIKLNQNGDSLWTKTYLSILTNRLVGQSIVKTSDNHFLICGERDPGLLSVRDAFIMKTDSAGNLIWIKEYSNQVGSIFWTVIETSDHGYLAGGNSYAGFGANQIAYVVKTDSAGNEQWHQTYSPRPFANCWTIINNNNGTNTLIGEITTGLDPANCKCLLININSTNGNELSHYLYGDTLKYQSCSRGLLTSDGKYLMIGVQGGYHGENLLAIKADSSGNIQWYQAYNDSLHTYYASDVKETCDSGFIITGQVSTFDTLTGHFGIFNSFLFKTDQYGNKQWEKIENGIAPNALYNIKEYYDRGFVVTGGYPNGCYVARFDSVYICNPTGIHENNFNSINFEISVYPNPCTSNTTIDLIGPNETPNFNLTMYDIFGRTIKTSKLNSGKNNFDTKFLISGIYFYKISDGRNLLKTGKLLIEN